MPALSSIDPVDGIVFTTGIGGINGPLLHAHMDWLETQTEFRPEFNQIVNLTPMHEVNLQPEDIRRLSLRAVFSEPSRRAIIVATPLQFGLARMYATLRSLEGEPHIRVCQDLVEAAEWVRIPATRAREVLLRLQRQLESGEEELITPLTQ
jgi:hypothetical protein